MFHQKIKSLFQTSVSSITSNISEYTVNPGKDLSRNKKLPSDKLISFLVSQGASSTKNELLDFFDMSLSAPSASAFNQQRAKLKPEALEAVFKRFNMLANSCQQKSGYRFIAADGSTFTFPSRPSFASEEYYTSGGRSSKGFYSMCLNAFYDLSSHTYTDAIIQPVHSYNEFGAFCEIVDRHEVLKNTKNVYIGDRGYCSYNNMAHVIENGQCFLFRAKDIHSQGLVGNFEYPDTDTFDVSVKVTLVRSNSKKLKNIEGYRRFLSSSSTFDYVESGSWDTYGLSFRIVRFPLSDTSYECIVTNLPAEEFPLERIKELYYTRWGIESSFRKLKYTIGLSNFHAYKSEYIKQEIWAKMIAYNITEILINHTIVEKKETKYKYKVNFSTAAHICRIFLRLTTEKDSLDVMSLLQKELTPIRNERNYPRLKTANFRKPRCFTYRAA